MDNSMNVGSGGGNKVLYCIWMNSFGEMCKARYAENGKCIKLKTHRKSGNYIAELTIYHMRWSYNVPSAHTPRRFTVPWWRYAVVYRWLAILITIRMHMYALPIYVLRECKMNFIDGADWLRAVVCALSECDDWHQDLIPARVARRIPNGAPHCALLRFGENKKKLRPLNRMTWASVAFTTSKNS